MDLEFVYNLVKEKRYEWRKHSLARLEERNIRQDEVLEVILKGEIIEDYPQNKPFPSCLLFKIVNNRPLHVVISVDKENRRLYIITCYIPTLDKFEPDYKTRRK